MIKYLKALILSGISVLVRSLEVVLMVMHEQVKLLYARERIVCDQIFEDFDSLRDQCFGAVIGSGVSVLLSFGDAIAKSKRSLEKLFVLLDIYEIMHKLHSKVS